jgi:hypothetical protein
MVSRRLGQKVLRMGSEKRRMWGSVHGIIYRRVQWRISRIECMKKLLRFLPFFALAFALTALFLAILDGERKIGTHPETVQLDTNRYILSVDTSMIHSMAGYSMDSLKKLYQPYGQSAEVRVLHDQKEEATTATGYSVGAEKDRWGVQPDTMNPYPPAHWNETTVDTDRIARMGYAPSVRFENRLAWPNTPEDSILSHLVRKLCYDTTPCTGWNVVHISGEATIRINRDTLFIFTTNGSSIIKDSIPHWQLLNQTKCEESLKILH